MTAAVFPERVDFLNGPGFLDGGSSRTTAACRKGGPKLVLSPFGVFDFEPVSKRMRVMSLHRAWRLQQVQKHTRLRSSSSSGTPPVN